MKMNKLWFVGLVAVALSISSASALDTETLRKTGSAFTKIAKEALPAVVFIDVESTVQVQPRGYSDPFEQLFGRGYGSPYGSAPQTYRRQGQGSGFIISKDGYILTNNHVINDADRIQVTLGDGRTFQAELVGTDPQTEVALIRIEDDEDFPFLTLGDSDALQVGEWVIAAGNPFGLTQTITAGIVSAKERTEVGITDYDDFIQTDAAINPGNSGGPLLDIDGKVVGINTAIYSQSGGYMGIGFALPINQAIAIKNQLIKTGTVQRSQLGVYIQDIDEELAESFGLEESGGILISQVMEGSAAEKAGIEAGDIVVEINGRKAGKTGSFRNRIAAMPPKTKVDLKLFRDGDYVKVTAMTQAMQDVAVGLAKNQLGIAVVDRDSAEAEQYGPLGRRGVLVSEVEEGSVAWRAGIEPGHLILSVNRQRTNDVESFNEVLKASRDGSRILLLVSDGQSARFIVVTLE